MKRLILFIALSVLSLSAFAQFPLGASKEEIRTYFGQNVSYANVQEFTTTGGTEALTFTKVRVVGDYTFYFNEEGACVSYVETYDKKDMDEVIWRFDRKFCRLANSTWGDEESSFNVTLIANPKKGANFISIVYKPAPPVTNMNNNGTVLASN